MLLEALAFVGSRIRGREAVDPEALEWIRNLSSEQAKQAAKTCEVTIGNAYRAIDIAAVLKIWSFTARESDLEFVRELEDRIWSVRQRSESWLV